MLCTSSLAMDRKRERYAKETAAHRRNGSLTVNTVVCLADIEQVAQRQVTLVAGGGSGHEPGHAGYVGHGMLSAAVCGHVFASPSASQVLAALERVQSPHGTLVIVMNYTGDCLNFGLAVERAKARGIKVAMVIIGDDISVQENTRVGRRGMAATTLAIKLAGALAARGQVSCIHTQCNERETTHVSVPELHWRPFMKWPTESIKRQPHWALRLTTAMYPAAALSRIWRMTNWNSASEFTTSLGFPAFL